ncbi:MAG: hypothetical protein KGS72_03060 [Cyanobacteria bacterium REEB67]|nr:hypothetical protein [Cyanobacteria bacterium REEB67]
MSGPVRSEKQGTGSKKLRPMVILALSLFLTAGLQSNYTCLAQNDGGQPYQGNPNGQYQNQGYPQGQPAQSGQNETFNAQQQPPYQPPYQQPYQQSYQQPPMQLQGQAVMIGAGTEFQASLINTLDSGVTQPGEQVQATLSQPLMGSNGSEAIPAGSTLTGNISNVVSAKRFRFGANGKIDIKFTSVRTPDGRVFPLQGSVDGNQVKLVGGSTAGRVGKGLLTTGIGAGGGAALGTGLGAIVGATSHGQVGRATGMGAVFGTAIGGGVGLVGAGVRKGSEVIFKAGTSLPIKLDQSMQVTTQVAGQPYGSQPYYPPQQPQYQQPPQYQQQYQQQPAPQYQKAPPQYQQQQPPQQAQQQPQQVFQPQPVWTPNQQ